MSQDVTINSLDISDGTDNALASKQASKQWQNIVLQGDCIETLKELPDKIIDCCVTSPPYYGLRDYGTGKWVGGDPNCPHKRLSKYSDKTATGHKQIELIGNVGDAIFKTVCPLCGAVREDKQIGLEKTPEQYIDKLVQVFREVKRVLKDDGTLWVNIGDSYCGTGDKGDYKDPKYADGRNGQSVAKNRKIDGVKSKDLIGIPWMLAFALRNDGWYLRQDIIWHKPNPMPESVQDRCTKSHEYIFLFSKKQHYYFNHEAIQEVATGYDGRKDTLLKGSPKYADDAYMPNQNGQTMASRGHERWKFKNLQDKGQQVHTMHERRANGEKDILYPVRNKRDVWTVATKPYSGAHFATFPEDLIEPCILAGSRVDGIVLDPFFGSGTTGRVAIKLNRNYVGCELNPEYIEISNDRTSNVQMTLDGFI